MRKIFLIIGVIAFVMIQGCSNEKSKDVESNEAVTDQNLNQAEMLNSDSQQTTVSQPAEISGDQEVSSPVQASAATGMNPAHGEPGHRCDIAVGAPLNSPPGKNALAAPTMINADPNVAATPNSSMSSGSPDPTQSDPAVTPVAPTPPGMNPPHGQPGHDCKIAVGAPLKK